MSPNNSLSWWVSIPNPTVFVEHSFVEQQSINHPDKPAWLLAMSLIYFSYLFVYKINQAGNEYWVVHRLFESQVKRLSQLNLTSVHHAQNDKYQTSCDWGGICLETQYEMHDGNLLAIIEVFKTWHQYIESCKHEIFVFTDYNILRRLINIKSLSAKQVQWA